MFSLMLHKIMHKKWMVLCLLIGNILLISVAASYPLYRVSSFQRMLTDEFDKYAAEKNCWPAMLSVTQNVTKGGGKIGIYQVEEEAYAAVQQLGVEMLDEIANYTMSMHKAIPAVVRDNNKDKRITLGAVTDLAEHVEVLYGRMPSDTLDDKGFIEIMVSDDAMVSQDILLEDEYTFDADTLANGDTFKLKVVGIFRPLDESERYWQAVENVIDQQVYCDIKVFRDHFLGKENEKRYSLTAKWNFVWNYESLEIGRASSIVKRTEQIKKTGLLQERTTDNGYMEVLEQYSNKAKRTEATLLILQVPVLLLLCAFLYMISAQMLQMERNEISMLRSRGASKQQVFLIYLMQSSFLSAVSVPGGMLFGALFCKLLGSSTAFLEFSATRNLPVRFTTDLIPYTLAAVLLSIVMTTIPVLSYSGLSIVKLKQSRSRVRKPFWKKMYLDVILLAISLYGFYSFRKGSDQVLESVLSGETLDPLLYISFSLFILGAGLLCARLQPILLKGFFAVFKNLIKPATYASILGTVRTGAKQDFIILFLILTVAIGISDTTIAQTIVLNAVNNTRHLEGAEIVLKEKWHDTKALLIKDPSAKLEFTEPDFGKYNEIPGTEQVTPVLVDNGGTVIGKRKLQTTIMGIRPRGFYHVTRMQDGLLPYSYEEYLNAMAADPRAVLVSENLLLTEGYKLGDIISFENREGWRSSGRIYGFFNYWPTYKPQSYTLDEKGELLRSDNTLIVANLPYLQQAWGAYPYEVWMNVEDNGEGFYNWLEEQKDLKVTKLTDMSEREESIIQDTMFQGTNGILSMSFIVILLLCCVGYLIYWIMSIRSRELLFGVLRAMGMRRKEITWMLVVEQICSGLYAIVCGGLIGAVASRMFVPMIQQAYAASEQVLPMQLIARTQDVIQLFAVIAVMLLVCLVVLGKIVSGMNISNALKLGED